MLVDVDLLDDVNTEPLFPHLPREVEAHELLVRRVEPEPREHQVILFVFDFFGSAACLLDPFQQWLLLLHGWLHQELVLASRAKIAAYMPCMVMMVAKWRLCTDLVNRCINMFGWLGPYCKMSGHTLN